MRSSRRAALALGAGVAGSVLLLGACTSGGGGTVTPSPQASGSITMWNVVPDSGPTAADAALRSQIDAFHQTNPSVDVTVVPVPRSTALARFRAASANGSAPDVVRMPMEWVVDLASRGLLSGLDGTTLTSADDDYFPSALSSTVWQNVQYGVPADVDAPALLYDTTLLRKAGVSVPTTWDELRAAAPALRTKAAATALYAPQDAFLTQPFLFSMGGGALDTEKKKITIVDDASVKGFQTALDLIGVGAAQRPSGTNPVADARRQFASGKVAMMLGDSQDVAAVSLEPAFSDPTALGIAPTPSGDVTGASPVTGDDWVVSAGTTNSAAAVALVSWMVESGHQADVAAATGLLPSRRSAYQQEAVSGNRVVQAFRAVLNKSAPQSWVPSGERLYPPWDEQWTAMYDGQVTVPDGVDAIAAEWVKFLVGYSD